MIFCDNANSSIVVKVWYDVVFKLLFDKNVRGIQNTR